MCEREYFAFNIYLIIIFNIQYKKQNIKILKIQTQIYFININ